MELITNSLFHWLQNLNLHFPFWKVFILLIHPISYHVRIMFLTKFQYPLLYETLKLIRLSVNQNNANLLILLTLLTLIFFFVHFLLLQFLIFLLLHKLIVILRITFSLLFQFVIVVIIISLFLSKINHVVFRVLKRFNVYFLFLFLRLLL